MGFTARYVLAVILPPLAVIGLGRRSATMAPITVFFLASVATLVLEPFTGWMLLGDLLWLAAAVWSVLTVRGAEDDLRHEPTSTADHHIAAERHFPAEDQRPPEE